MKVYLIKASAPGPFKEYKKAMGAPPQNIFSVAAATPEGVDVVMCDETIGMKPNLREKADIVALFFHTPDAPHTYRLASRFKENGRTVVLGGLHASLMPDEAQAHADALLIGEAEGIWEDLLRDFEAGALEKRYRRDKPIDLATVRPYPTDLIPPHKYGYFWSVLVARGCVNRCEFCTIPPFFRGKYRVRPVENIVAEIKAAPAGCWFELHADHLTANRKYALELFNALKPLNINWVGEATLALADDAELLRAAAESGCKNLLIGIETPSQAALSESGKGFVDTESVREKIRRFHEYDIAITSSMIFGFDSHTKEIFQESADFSRSVEIDEVESVILIPFAGTPLFNRLDSEGRILTKDWSKYDGSHVVFEPKNMTAAELDSGADQFWLEMSKKKPRRRSSPGDSGRSSNPLRSSGGPKLTTSRGTFKWKSVLALAAIGFALVFELSWVWGVIFLLWAATDLRHRVTHLLDEIPRAENPILYWLVVLMWLVSGAWFLLVPHDLAWGSAAVIAPAVNSSWVETQLIDQSHSDTTKRVFRNTRFGFTIGVPDEWRHDEDSDRDGVSLEFEDEAETGSVTVIAIDWQTDVELDEFISIMEEEIAKEFPFLRSAARSTPENPVPDWETPPIPMSYQEFVGVYAGYDIRTLIAYGVHGEHGFVIMGVHGVGDRRMMAAINDVFSSFLLDSTE